MARWINDREIGLGSSTKDADLARTTQRTGASLHCHPEHFFGRQPGLKIGFRDVLQQGRKPDLLE